MRPAENANGQNNARKREAHLPKNFLSLNRFEEIDFAFLGNPPAPRVCASFARPVTILNGTLNGRTNWNRWQEPFVRENPHWQHREKEERLLLSPSDRQSFERFAGTDTRSSPRQPISGNLFTAERFVS